MKLKKLLKTYNGGNYYHLYIFKGVNALVSDLAIENNNFSFINEEILNMKVFDWWDKYCFNVDNGQNKNWMQLTVRVE